MDAKWLDGKHLWTYWSPRRGVLGMVWEDLDLYAATAGTGKGYPNNAEWGEYPTLREAKDVVEGVVSGSISLHTSKPRDFGSLGGNVSGLREEGEGPFVIPPSAYK